MQDIHALVQAYASVNHQLDGLRRLKEKLNWDDQRLYEAFLKLKQSAPHLRLIVNGECDDRPPKPKLLALRIYPATERAKRYPLMR